MATCTSKCGGNTGKEASAVFDLALMLFGIHHIIEYIRLLVIWIVAMIGVNLMHLYYATALNTFLGIAAFFVSIGAVAGAGGCSEAQPNRFSWLIVEIVLFAVTSLFYSFPFIFFKCLKKQDIEIILVDDEIVDEVVDRLTEEKKRKIEEERKKREHEQEQRDADAVH